MMKSFIHILFFALALSSCKKEEAIEVSFFIKTQGFILENSSALDVGDFATFSHRLSGGIVTFTGDRDSYKFDLQGAGIEEYTFKLPVGLYQLDIRNPEASIYGQEDASFLTETSEIEIEVESDTLFIQVEANCCLVLVQDEGGQLEQGAFLIERHSYSDGYFTSYPMSVDTETGLYFAYFTPDPESSDPTAFLWFFEGLPGESDESEGGMPTHGFEKGYQYNINILE